MPSGGKWRGKCRLVISTVALFLIITGVALVLFPFLQNLYYQRTAQTSHEPIVTEAPAQTPPVPEVAKSPEKIVPAPARLVIPKLDLDLSVGYGIGEQDLKKGPGIYPQSGSPDTGNVSIAGHRNAYGSPFYHLDKMAAGDEIFLSYQQKTYHYTVEKVFETHSRDWSVIDPTPRPALTLTTCTPLHPIDGKYNRLIVRAYLRDIKE